MKETMIECQGLPCPQPVLKCKKAIEEDQPEKIVAVVDNEAAKENVSRFLSMQGYEVEISGESPDFTITGNKSECEACAVMNDEQLADLSQQKIVVFITADTLGTGDDTLGAGLMYNFVATLKEMGEDLWRIVMVNGGVKLAVEGSKQLEELQKLEKNGVSILVCGTCLEHFGLTASKQVGDVTNMLDVVTSLQLASKVIRV